MSCPFNCSTRGLHIGIISKIYMEGVCNNIYTVIIPRYVEIGVLYGRDQYYIRYIVYYTYIVYM